MGRLTHNTHACELPRQNQFKEIGVHANHRPARTWFKSEELVLIMIMLIVAVNFKVIKKQVNFMN